MAARSRTLDRRRAGRPSGPWLTGRAAIVALLALVAAIGAAMFSASLLEARSQPAIAARLWPWNSIALANLAGNEALPGASPGRLAAARDAARRALMLDPGNPVAARALGVLAGIDGRGAAAVRALLYGEAMSRRDLQTQLALIEWRVQQGDVAGALRHYDRALRTTRSVPLLLSTMIGASADPAIRRQVVGLLAQRPFWRPAFLVQLLDENTSAGTVAGIVGALRLDAADPAERQVLAGAIGKLIGQGQVAAARRLLPPSATPVRNGGFEKDNPFPPLDWALASEAELNATVEPGPAEARRGAVLFPEARNGRGGEVASQWLSLAPGRYRLSYVAGDIAGDEGGRPRWSISCGSERLGEATLPAAPPAGRPGAIGFAVPVGCPAQRLVLTLPISQEGAGGRPWMDDVAVAAAR